MNDWEWFEMNGWLIILVFLKDQGIKKFVLISSVKNVDK